MYIIYIALNYFRACYNFSYLKRTVNPFVDMKYSIVVLSMQRFLTSLSILLPKSRV